MTIPDWWLIISGLAFLLSILINVVLVAGLIIGWKKISPLLDKLQGQVDQIGTKVSDIASSAQSTAGLVKDRTVRILGATEEASAEVTRKISAVGASLTTVFVVIRLIGALRGMAGQHKKKK